MKNNKLKWFDFVYNLNNKLLTKKSLKKSLTVFWENELKMYEKERYINILFKVKMENGTVRSISPSQLVKIDEFNQLYTLFNSYLDITSEQYKSTKLDSIFFTYIIYPLDIKINRSSISKPKKSKKNISFTFAGYNLPKTMDICNWGKNRIL